MFSSSDQSHVMVFPNEDRVQQTFDHLTEYERVKHVALDLELSGPLNLLFEDGTIYTFSAKDFHSRLLKYEDDAQTIHWARIACFNQMRGKMYLSIIRKNWVKFLWDALKGILAIHLCGYHHGDVSLDNMGVRDQHFVCFDYNLSQKSLHFTQEVDREIHRLRRSLRFHFDIKPTQDASFFEGFEHVHSIQEFVYWIQERHKFDTLSETLNYLDSLEIV